MLTIGTVEGKDFKLPLEAVTQTFAILAKRGVGKSYTASVMAEEMLTAGQPIVALDPTGAWWGLREKFPVVIFGGEHADVPLEEGAGEVIARAIVENRFPAIIDLSLFRKGQMIRFMVAFLETLYRLNREALHLFVDEADAFAPQAKNYGGDENRMLGAMEDIVRRGRKRGIGCTLITQRPAVLNKNVLTQCEILVALRLVHPKDIDAIEEWVNVHAEPEKAQAMIQSLPSLPIGTAWFWAPGWGDIFDRVKVRKRFTFDSGSTPKPGEEARKPKALAAVDIKALGQQIASTVERAKADDPKALRSEIAILRKELAAAEKMRQAAELAEKVARDEKSPEIVEVPALKDGELKALIEISERLIEVGKHIASAVIGTERKAKEPTATPPSRPSVFHRRIMSKVDIGNAVLNGTTDNRKIMDRVVESSIAAGLSNRQQRFLDAAAALQTLGSPTTRETVSAWVGVHPRGGSVGEDLGKLAEAGMITIDRGAITVTAQGQRAANVVDPSVAIDQAKSGLSPRQRDFFELICNAYPETVSREGIAEAKGIHPRGGSLGEDLGRLVGRGLVVYQGKGYYRARDFLFAGQRK